MEEKVRMSGTNAAVEHLAGEYESLGLSLTVARGEQVLACALVRPIHPGVIELTALLSVAFVEHTLSAGRACKEIIAGLFKQLHLHRIQTTVRSDFPAGLRFVKWLGFRREGVARQYSHDRVDAIYYAIMR